MNEVSNGLMKLGLTQYQSSALSIILENEGCSAEIVSEKGGIPITKVYSVLQSLEYMGFIRANLERPKKYFSIGVDEIFNSLIERKKQDLTQLRKEAKKALKVISKQLSVAAA